MNFIEIFHKKTEKKGTFGIRCGWERIKQILMSPPSGHSFIRKIALFTID